jgi:uncharacterized protein (TIGR02246 family)
MRPTVLALCLLLSTTVPSLAQARPKDATAIRNRIAAYEAAVNKHDADAIAAMFTPDADFVFFDGPRIVGRDSIGKVTQESVSRWPRTKRFTLEVTTSDFSDPITRWLRRWRASARGR